MGVTPPVRILLGRLPLLVGYLLLSSCAQVPQAVYPTVPGIREIDLKWQPAAGMRLAYQITTTVTVGGSAAQSLSANQRSHRVNTRVWDITSVGPDFFEARSTTDGTTIPATIRLARDWMPIDLRFDPQALTENQQNVLRKLLLEQEMFAQAPQYFRHWTIDEARRFEVQLPIPGIAGEVVPLGTKMTFLGEVTFRRVVLIRDRAAAEFHATGRGEVTLRGGKGRVDTTSREWVDLATGAWLVRRATSREQFSGQGKEYQIETETHEELDFARSRGL